VAPDIGVGCLKLVLPKQNINITGHDLQVQCFGGSSGHCWSLWCPVNSWYNEARQSIRLTDKVILRNVEKTLLESVCYGCEANSLYDSFYNNPSTLTLYNTLILLRQHVSVFI
jgi:hypothetical protein